MKRIKIFLIIIILLFAIAAGLLIREECKIESARNLPKASAAVYIQTGESLKTVFV